MLLLISQNLSFNALMLLAKQLKRCAAYEKCFLANPRGKPDLTWSNSREAGQLKKTECISNISTINSTLAVTVY